jgi:hypothetical protein
MRVQSRLGKKTAQEIGRSLRCGIEFNLIDLGDFAPVCDDDAVNWSVGRNRNVINDSINGVPQKLETGNESDIEVTVRQSFAQSRWVIGLDVIWPAANEGTRVEIFYATDAE